MGQGELRPTPVDVGLALLGALAMIVAVFLPRVEETSFSLAGVAENTLIQSGDGWLFIGLAAGVAISTYRNHQSGQPGWTVVVLGAIAIAYAFYAGTSDDSLTLYQLDEEGNPNLSGSGEKAKPGIGIYVAGVGGALAAFGGWRQRTLVPVPRATQGTTPASASPPKTSPPAGSSTIQDLERLQALHREGVLTDEQFDSQKQRVLERDSS